MSIGVISISTNRKVEPNGPPFPVTSANNGASVAATGEIVLGNDVGGIAATLLNSREIPTAGFNINLSGTGNLGIGTTLPSGRIHALSAVNNASMIISENSIDNTNSSAQFRAMIGGGSITEFGTTGAGFTINPNLAASGFIQSNAANGIIVAATGVGPASFRILTSLVGEVIRVTNIGNMGIGVNAPDAFLEIKPGTAAIGGAPIKLNAGGPTAIPETGALEWDGANVLFTNAATRENFLIGNDGAAAPGTTAGVAITNFYGTAATNFLGDPNSWAGVVINGITYKIPLYT